MRIDRRRLYHIDWIVVILAIALFTIGFLNLVSALSSAPYLLRKQISIFFVGCLFVPVMLLYDYRELAEKSIWFYIVVLILTALTLILGTKISGAKRWISIFGINMQPSEFMKIALVLFLAQLLHEKRASNTKLGIRDILLPMLFTFIPVFFILLQPDLGTAAILFIVAFSMLWHVGFRKYLYVLFICLGTLSPYVLWEYVLRPYQKLRILVFLGLASDPRGFEYHTRQAKIAVGSGKIFGKGFMQGTQHKLQFVPEHHTDFIFTVFGEEWGFIGSIILIILFLLFIRQCLKISQSAADALGSMMAFGIASLLYFQFTINIFMALHILPAVGVPMPFMSYGGSSLLCLLFSIGILLNINSRRYMF